MKTYGAAALRGTQWEITGVPHMLRELRCVFRSGKPGARIVTISHNPGNAARLEWFTQLYPLEFSYADKCALSHLTAVGRAAMARTEEILANPVCNVVYATKLPLRDYQKQGVEVLNIQSELFCGDVVGLGKTAIGLGAMASGLTPAIVVCKTHLQHQWVEEAHKFLDGVKPHIVKKGTPYVLPAHDLLIIPYSKLTGWCESLAGYKLLIYDEIQELRRHESNKYSAAQRVSENTPNVLGLSMTPVYNYGDEMFNVMEIISPGLLGTRGEFYAEWCTPVGSNHYKVKEPTALHSYLKESGKFIRRTRKDVGRELPPVTRITEEVEYTSKDLLAIEDKALELAQTIVRGEWSARGQAARELDGMLRMQTAIAKAPFVAQVATEASQAEEGGIVLVGWHREFYEICGRAFRAAGVKYVMYTGSESPTQKVESVKRYVEGKADVFMASLRSGEGLNGLQFRGSMIIFGEFDWSPQVHEQWIGRLTRDGQESPVTALFLMADGGSDPVIAQVAGIKRAQAEGVMTGTVEAIEDEQATLPRAAELAKHILEKYKS